MDYRKLFTDMKPDFFGSGEFNNISENVFYEELVMTSDNTEYNKIEIPVPAEVVYRFADTSDEEEMKKIQAAVREVDTDWVQYFTLFDSKIYCGYIGEKVVSFCLMSEMGTHYADGKQLHIGGPGCVGTIPEYRRKGIALKMVQNVTRILFTAGYDISWIHYTEVGPWYAKLGYRTVLKWNKKGIVESFDF